MEKKNRKQLEELNGILRETDELYHTAARALGLSDCAFWILYTLRDQPEAPTQSAICNSIYAPKQTVNSALKKLERAGTIRLASGSDRRQKRIVPTEKLEALIQETIDAVRRAECRALNRLNNGEQREFLRLYRRFTDALRHELAYFEKRE